MQLENEGDEAGKSVAEGFFGLLAVGAACILSGLAGVWFEKVLKGTKASLFLRNIQLSLFSIVPGLVFGGTLYLSRHLFSSISSISSLSSNSFLVYVANGASVAENGFFYGYNVWTWTTILCQALGGLIVAVVVKYADNILKGFATSLSIILSCIASVFLFEFVVSGSFVVGAGVVLYATHLYGLPDADGGAAARKKDKPLLPSTSQDGLDKLDK